MNLMQVKIGFPPSLSLATLPSRRNDLNILLPLTSRCVLLARAQWESKTGTRMQGFDVPLRGRTFGRGPLFLSFPAGHYFPLLPSPSPDLCVYHQNRAVSVVVSALLFFKCFFFLPFRSLFLARPTAWSLSLHLFPLACAQQEPGDAPKDPCLVQCIPHLHLRHDLHGRAILSTRHRPPPREPQREEKEEEPRRRAPSCLGRGLRRLHNAGPSPLSKNPRKNDRIC